MQSEISPAKGLNMKLGPSLLMLAIAGSVVPDAAAGQKARLDPVAAPQYTPIIVAEKSQATRANFERTIGVCKPIESSTDPTSSAINSVSPVGVAYSYLKNIEHQKIDDATYFAAKMTLLQAPMHGTLELYEKYKAGSYEPSDFNYTGPDRATVLVEFGVYKVKVMYYFELMHGVPGSNEAGSATDNKAICPNGRVWKISFNPDDPNALVYGAANRAANRVLPFATPIKGARLDLFLPNRSHLN